MAFFKLQHLFAHPGYGWTEAWYLNSNITLAAALSVAEVIGVARSKLLGTGTRYLENQVSVEPDPATGTLANPGNPRATRGDSLVSVGVKATSVYSGNKTSADPWEAILLNFVGTAGADPNGVAYRRSFLLRGWPFNAVQGGTGVGVTFDPAFLQGLKDFAAALVKNNICIRAATKGGLTSRVSFVAAGTAANTVNLTNQLSGLSPGAVISISGWPRGEPGYNGRHHVVAQNDTTHITTIASTAGVIAPPNNNIISQVVMGYFPMIARDIAPRLAKKATGAERWVSRAQKKRRKVSI